MRENNENMSMQILSYVQLKNLNHSYLKLQDSFLEGLGLSREKEQLFEDLLDAYNRMLSFYFRHIYSQN